MLRPYRDLVTVPHLPMLLVWSLLGRLHIPAVPIALTTLAADWTGSYAIAGLIVGAGTLGTAISGPLRGRMADRASAPRQLLLAAVGYGTAMLALAALPDALWPLATLIALGGGLCSPPVAQIARACWPRITTGTVRESVYTVEATLQELTFVVTPLVAASTVALLSPRAALIGAGVVALIGAVGFGGTLSRAGLGEPEPRPAATSARPGHVLAAPGLLAAIAVLTLTVAGLVSVDLVMVAWTRDAGVPAAAGPLMACFALGSLIGGLVSGGFTKPPRLIRRMVLMTAGIFLLVPTLPPVLEPGSMWLTGAALLVTGVFIAPALAASTSRVGELAPSDRRAEAFGWLAAGMTTGTAIAAPLSGALMDTWGPAAAVGGAALLCALGVALSFWVAAASRRG